MNQFFSFNRFSLLVLKHWADNKKRYGLSVLAFIGLLIAWFVFTIIATGSYLMPVDMQKATFFFSIIVVGTFYASQFYSDLGSKAKATTFLLIPASTFEKLLCSLFYTFLLFFIVFTATFYLVDYLMVTMVNSFFNNNGQVPKAGVVDIFNVNLIRFRNGSAINFLLFYFALQSAFLFGSVYFRKYNFIKTIISGFIIWFAILFLVYVTCKFYKPDGRFEGPFVDGPDWMAELLRYVVMYAVAPVFWIVTYYSLKQKQV